MSIELAENKIREAQRVLDEALAYLDAQPAEPELPDGYLSPHFRESEFTCNHCNSLEGHEIPQELLAVLEDVRAHFNAPVTINSGYRCKTHNTNVGSSEGSWHRYHTQGEGAADIVVPGVSASTVHAYLVAKYPNRCGIGRYFSFTHLDNDADKRRW